MYPNIHYLHDPSGLQLMQFTGQNTRQFVEEVVQVPQLLSHPKNF